MESQFSQRWIKKFRILTLTVIFSGALNIGLIAALLVLVKQHRKSAISYLMAPVQEHVEESPTNSALLTGYAQLSFRELAALLTNTALVEEGYRKRDLALAALVSFHEFNLEKALGGTLLQRRTLAMDHDRVALLFPALTDDQFQAIIRFAYLEKWPLTTKGLFSHLHHHLPHDATLRQAFALTPEFYALQVLFQKCESPVEVETLIHLVSEGTWAMLDGFAREQSQMMDLSVERRRRLLLSYLALPSPTAARLLLQTDAPFLLKRLDDKGILDLLEQLRDIDEPARQFCIELLQSPRSDAIWMKSAALLYQATQEPLPEPFDRVNVITRFVKQTPASPPLARETTRRTHIVQEGESLWKIARQYKVNLDELVALNGLDKDRIRSGMLLQIP